MPKKDPMKSWDIGGSWNCEIDLSTFTFKIERPLKYVRRPKKSKCNMVVDGQQKHYEADQEGENKRTIVLEIIRRKAWLKMCGERRLRMLDKRRMLMKIIK